jgi:hypothetical protein
MHHSQTGAPMENIDHTGMFINKTAGRTSLMDKKLDMVLPQFQDNPIRAALIPC